MTEIVLPVRVEPGGLDRTTYVLIDENDSAVANVPTRTLADEVAAMLNRDYVAPSFDPLRKWIQTFETRPRQQPSRSDFLALARSARLLMDAIEVIGTPSFPVNARALRGTCNEAMTKTAGMLPTPPRDIDQLIFEETE